VDPDDYLAFVHDIDLSALETDHRLGAALARLSGRRYVFTNGCRHHAARVLARLGIAQHFDGVWDIRTIAWRPKPDVEAYRDVVTDHAVDPARAAMFEDMARNLVPAHELGMTTVWLRNDSAWSKQGPDIPVPQGAHIHYQIDQLADFLHSIRI
jgi:putative hydrolase of the HAD superfamily